MTKTALFLTVAIESIASNEKIQDIIDGNLIEEVEKHYGVKYIPYTREGMFGKDWRENQNTWNIWRETLEKLSGNAITYLKALLIEEQETYGD